MIFSASNNRRLSLLIAGMLIFVGCTDEKQSSTTTGTNRTVAKISRPDPSFDETEAKIFRMNVAEEFVLQLTPKFQFLTRHLKGEQTELNLIFDDSIKYSGISDGSLQAMLDSQTGEQDSMVKHFDWPLLDESSIVTISPNEIWAPLTRHFQFQDTGFGILACETDPDIDALHMKVSFEGRIEITNQGLVGVKAEQTLTWYPTEDGDWKIGEWGQDKFKVVATSGPLFEIANEKSVPDLKTRETLKRSLHRDLLIDRTENRTILIAADSKEPYFSDWESLFHYPSVSVVDLDSDDWDDMFIVDRWGESVLLRNNGDGTFVDVSASIGLKLNPCEANCASFFDIDNDGDSDVFVARTNEPSLFFRNEGGHFVPDAEINKELADVRFVTSSSVIDVNRDGLLDLYLCTYCSSGGDPEVWVPHAVAVEDRVPMKVRIRRSHQYLDRPGPPNIMLINQQGTLKRVKIDDALKQWKNSFQSVWMDFDDDGDSDVYVCSDFAPDAFLRNDTPQGSNEVSFVDITESVVPGGSMCFGMGASVGDYNSDGQLDLYVSNMYSKAGNRIIQQLGDNADPRVAGSARGNFLYQKSGSVFQQVAGMKEDQQHVSKVGWSFGGQLADFDNDEKLDIYVSSGFFTAPEPIDAQLDL